MGDMKSQKPMSEDEIDKNLVDSFPASDPPSWTVGTDHKAPTREEQGGNRLMRGAFHQLARFFNGLHWAAGMTTLPETATAKEERSFVLMWLGIVVFVIVFFAGFIYFLTW
jgi:hypothetical protein